MNSSIYSVLKDLTFLRTMGHLYFILVVLAVFVLMTLLFSKKFFNKKVKVWCKGFIKEKFWKKYLFGLINILFLPVFLMGLISMKDVTVKTPIQGFSIFSACLFIVGFLIIIGYFIFKLRTLGK